MRKSDIAYLKTGFDNRKNREIKIARKNGHEDKFDRMITEASKRAFEFVTGKE